LDADRPAPGRRGDDGRAAADARDLRGAPAAALLAGTASPGAAARTFAPVNPPASTSFSFEWAFLVLSAGAVWGYVRLARGAERPGPGRITLFALGIALVAFSLNSPLETIAIHYLLVIHLLQNVMVADWAPPLLILGLTPAMRAAVAGRGGRPLATLTRPAFALPLWLVVWYGVHLPPFYAWAPRP